MNEHYLDNAATTMVCPEAIAAASDAMARRYGNPSSTHTKGREAKKLLDSCRKQVADALSISKNTVDTHRRRIMDKLGCESMAELTKYAIREGFLTLE